MRIRPVIILAGLLLIAGCGGGDPEDGTGTPASPTASETTATGAGAAFPEGEPLDLLLLAESSRGGIAERYAPMAAEALGREVRVITKGVDDGFAGGDILAGDTDVREALDEAEIIVVHMFPGGFEPDPMLACLEALDQAIDDPDSIPAEGLDPPEVASIDDWQEYRDALDEVYSTIWEIRGDRPTILRAYGAWNPWISAWRQAGVGAECNANDALHDQVRQEAAEANGALFVPILDVINGPNRDEDPAPKGLLAEDGMHLSETGRDALAEALAKAGFEISQPPS